MHVNFGAVFAGVRAWVVHADYHRVVEEFAAGVDEISAQEAMGICGVKFRCEVMDDLAGVWTRETQHRDRGFASGGGSCNDGIVPCGFSFEHRGPLASNATNVTGIAGWPATHLGRSPRKRCLVVTSLHLRACHDAGHKNSNDSDLL